MTRIITLLAGALALAATPAAAEKVKPDIAEHRAIEGKNLASGKTPIDPAKAYIYIKSPQNRSFGVFLKTPSAEEIASYDTEWRRQLAKAREDYAKKLKRWETAGQAGRSSADKPIEPTEADFAIAGIDTRMIVSFGPQFIFDKTEGAGKSFSYLIEVEPGDYTWHGPIFYIPNGMPTGGCYCMGSVRFAAKAGQITSLGDFLTEGWASRDALAAASVERNALPDRPVRDTDWSVPDTLARYTVARAELRAAGKRDNFLNVMIGRMPPVPGVLAYDRDVPIDLVGLAQAQAEAAAPAPVAPAPAEAPIPAPAL